MFEIGYTIRYDGGNPRFVCNILNGGLMECAENITPYFYLTSYKENHLTDLKSLLNDEKTKGGKAREIYLPIKVDKITPSRNVLTERLKKTIYV